MGWKKGVVPIGAVCHRVPTTEYRSLITDYSLPFHDAFQTLEVTIAPISPYSVANFRRPVGKCRDPAALRAYPRFRCRWPSICKTDTRPRPLGRQSALLLETVSPRLSSSPVPLPSRTGHRLRHNKNYCCGFEASRSAARHDPRKDRYSNRLNYFHLVPQPTYHLTQSFR